MSGDQIALWVVLVIFVGASCAYSWYWYIRSVIFYLKNGFDFSVDFGPSMFWSEFHDDLDQAKPREKFLIGWPVVVAVSSALLLALLRL
ncbi:hypothetical protein B5E41_12245 [Rhizobium esperanzae]|uniref:Uncharacterized protein n=1 Tax=Rhizobium esperanzae TaxID=1967781 RepID=A0A246DW04_9HYPH|nr:hypothetical protein [Rhizobium esperanzae]OWO94527.1 hypothetical protein B5E41_12245 [Rhizobium esperanzae]